MLQSMTGYGEERRNNKEVDLLVQIKSVNHRFLTLEISSPRGISPRMEAEVRNRIKAKIARGKITINIQVKRTQLPTWVISANQELASRYHELLRQLSNSLGLNEEISLSHLLDLPDVICMERSEEEGTRIEELLFEASQRALAELLRMRAREGKNHLRSIQGWVKKIENLLPHIQTEFSQAQKDYKEKIRKSLKELLDQESGERLINEIPALVFRGDISEETVRFKSHLKELKGTLRRSDPVGKKVGFILQELNREINTIGAKTASFPISRLVIETKHHLERIREEIINIE